MGSTEAKLIADLAKTQEQMNQQFQKRLDALEKRVKHLEDQQKENEE